MHRNYAVYIISCVVFLGIFMRVCTKTPRGILPVTSNGVIPFTADLRGIGLHNGWKSIIIGTK